MHKDCCNSDFVWSISKVLSFAGDFFKDIYVGSEKTFAVDIGQSS